MFAVSIIYTYAFQCFILNFDNISIFKIFLNNIYDKELNDNPVWIGDPGSSSRPPPDEFNPKLELANTLLVPEIKKINSNK